MFGRRCRLECCSPDASAYDHEATKAGHMDAPIMVDGEAPIDWTEMHKNAKGVTALRPVVGISSVDAKLIMSDPACVKEVDANCAPSEPCAEDLPSGDGMKKAIESEDDDESTTGQPEEEPPERIFRRDSGLFQVELTKRDSCKRVGIDVNHFADDGAIPVLAITGGLAQEWNTENPDDAIEAGDVIIEVNGIMNDACQMLARCRDDANLTFTVVRHHVYHTPL